MSWTASGRFSGVFPLFGMLRRYWGRVAWIHGGYTIMGFSARSNRSPHITHSFMLSVHSRRPRVLRYTPIEVVGHIAHGPRSDLYIHGASLQWDGSGTDVGGDRLRFPQEVDAEQLRVAFRSRVLPHSFARYVRGSWEIRLPERTIETAGRDQGDDDEEEEGCVSLRSPHGRHLA